MAILHAAAGQAIDVRPLGAHLPGARTSALFKSAQLEVMRLVLVAGKALPEHAVPGEITIQCIEGRIDVLAQGAVHPLEPGQMLFLHGGVPHAVRAIVDASALVTVVLADGGGEPRA